MDWKPKTWIATLLGLLVSPFGLLYVGKPFLALAYFTAILVAALLDLSRPDWLYGVLSPWFSILLLLQIACAVHCFFLARSSKAIPRRRWYSQWWGMVSLVAGYFVVALLIRSFLFEPFRHPSASMYPSLQEGQHFLIKKLGYGFYGSYGITLYRSAPSVPISRGDILVFRTPDDENVSYVKRVIGLPGDHVEVSGRQLKINDNPVTTTCSTSQPDVVMCRETLGDIEYGVAYFTARGETDFDTVVPAGHYFMLGDSRNNSRDSRFIGHVPAGNIVGRWTYTFGSDTSPTN